ERPAKHVVARPPTHPNVGSNPNVRTASAGGVFTECPGQCGRFDTMVGMVMVDVDDVKAAAKRISGRHVRTPLLPWPLAGEQGWLKPENVQPTGAFKLRGASNAIGMLSEAVRAAGVVTHSSGNQGRAVAWAARQYGVPAVVVMPDTTPQVKVEGVRDL